MFLTEGARPLTPEEIMYWMNSGDMPVKTEIPDIDRNRQEQIREGLNIKLDELNRNKVYKECIEDDINDYTYNPGQETVSYKNYEVVNANDFKDPDKEMELRMMREMGYNIPAQYNQYQQPQYGYQYNPYQQQPMYYNQSYQQHQYGYPTPPMDTRPMINTNPYQQQPMYNNQPYQQQYNYQYNPYQQQVPYGYQPMYNHNNVNMNGNQFYQTPNNYLGGYYSGNYYQVEYERQRKAAEAAREQQRKNECEIMKAISRAANYGLENGLTEEQIEAKWNNYYFPKSPEDNMSDEDKMFMANYNYLVNIHYNAPYGDPKYIREQEYRNYVREERMKIIPKDCDLNQFFNEVSLDIYERDEKIEQRKRKIEQLNNIYNHKTYDEALDRKRKENIMYDRMMHPNKYVGVSDNEIEAMQDKEYKAKEEAYMREMAAAAGLDYDEAVRKYGSVATTEEQAQKARESFKNTDPKEQEYANNLADIVNKVKYMDSIQDKNIDAKNNPKEELNFTQDDLFQMLMNGADITDIAKML